MQNKDQRLSDSVNALELYTGQKTQALQKAVVKGFEMIEQIIRARRKSTRKRFNIVSTCQYQR